MLPPWTHLRTALQHALPALHAISDSDASLPPAPDKWSPKEIIGHLIDSASNNHGRFVRAQLQEHMRFERYAQDDWVRVQHYRDASWTELIDLWHRLNLHLARVMEAAPPEQLDRPRTDHNLHERAFRSLPAGTPATLGWFMQDYVEHLQHHLRQVNVDVR